MPLVNGPLDWRKLHAIVFDMDGTIYDQRRLRIRMLIEMLRECVRSRDIEFLFTLHAFRKCREELAESEADEFMSLQYKLTAELREQSQNDIKRTVEEWIERRPLAFLSGCRYPGVAELIKALRSSGKIIAIFSDYPALQKAAALGIEADIVVSSEDVGRLKPNPVGLHRIMSEAGARPERCLLIGDRFDRDGAAATRCGVRALIRSKRPHPRYDTFRNYRDEVFSPVLRKSMPSSREPI